MIGWLSLVRMPLEKLGDNMGSLTLQQALTIIDGTLKAGNKIHTEPLTVAVLDSGGKLISLQRQDGSSMMRPDIAIAKRGEHSHWAVPQENSPKMLTTGLHLSPP